MKARVTRALAIVGVCVVCAFATACSGDDLSFDMNGAWRFLASPLGCHDAPETMLNGGIMYEQDLSIQQSGNELWDRSVPGPLGQHGLDVGVSRRRTHAGPVGGHDLGRPLPVVRHARDSQPVGRHDGRPVRGHLRLRQPRLPDGAHRVLARARLFAAGRDLGRRARCDPGLPRTRHRVRDGHVGFHEQRGARAVRGRRTGRGRPARVGSQQPPGNRDRDHRGRGGGGRGLLVPDRQRAEPLRRGHPRQPDARQRAARRLGGLGDP